MNDLISRQAAIDALEGELMEKGRYVYSKICSIIKEGLANEGIPSNCIAVLYDSYEYVYIVKIKNMMGEAEYRQSQRMIFLYGVNTFVEIIKRDFVIPKGVEE